MVAATYGLDQPALARMFAWISLSAIGAAFFGWLADRYSRRTALLAALALAPVGGIAAAVAWPLSSSGTRASRLPPRS